jgi:predicted RNase H-like nuclease
MTMDSLGIDGCRAGWIGILRGNGGFRWRVAATLDDVLPSRIPRRAFIDMPIGLCDRVPRHCDRLARSTLGRQFSSSVFPCPARRALDAANYDEANRHNRAALGVGLSKQSFFLLPKIREVDRWLRTQAKNPKQLREAHPEVAFMAINGSPLTHKKKTRDGFDERLSLLAALDPTAADLVREIVDATRRKDVAPDDVLDALCLALMPLNGKLQILPPRPPQDAEGLPMGIHFYS